MTLQRLTAGLADLNQCNLNQQNYGRCVVYVIEQRTSFKNLVKTWHENMNFKKIKKSDFLIYKKIMIFSTLTDSLTSFKQGGHRALKVLEKKLSFFQDLESP